MSLITSPKPTPTPSTKTPICFAHNHMTCRQYGLWSRIRELQHGRGFVFFDADFLSENFQATSRDVIYDDCTSLLKDGWFELLSARKRKRDGTWESRQIKALPHKDWALKNPGKCKKLQGSHSANSHAPLGYQRRTSRQIATHQSANSDEPVAPSQHRLRSNTDMVLNQTPVLNQTVVLNTDIVAPSATFREMEPVETNPNLNTTVDRTEADRQTGRTEGHVVAPPPSPASPPPQAAQLCSPADSPAAAPAAQCADETETEFLKRLGNTMARLQGRGAACRVPQAIYDDEGGP